MFEKHGTNGGRWAYLKTVGKMRAGEGEALMFCSHCGQPIQQQQTFCSACGAATGIELASNNPAARMFSRVSRHVQTVGVLWLAYAGYILLHWLLARTVMRAFFRPRPDFMGIPIIVQHLPQNAPWGGPFFGSWFITIITMILISQAVLAVAVGVALLTRQSWGRTFAIVIAILTLIKPFTGTALAIYTLWVLWGPYASEEYRQIAFERN